MEDEDGGVVALECYYEVETTAGAGDWFEVGLIVNITPPDEETEDVDVTVQKSPGGRKEYRPGLIEGGTSDFELRWVPGGATHTYLRQWKSSRETRSSRIRYPGDLYETFPAYPKNFPRTVNLGEAMAATLTVKVAGQPVWSDE